MSQFVGVPEFLRRAREHRHFLERKLADARRVNEQAAKYGHEVQQGLGAARQECAAVFLPGFDPASLATAERLALLPRGWAQKRVELVHVEDRKLADRVAHIEADDRFQFRTSYLGDQGEWRQEFAAAEKAFQTAQGHAQRFEHLPRFRELMASHYGTPDYRAGCLSFLDSNPKAAAQAMQTLGVNTWDQVRSDYEVARQTRDKKKHTVEEIKAKIASLEGLLTEREAAVARRAALAGEGPLLDSRTAIAEHLGRADRRALANTAKAAGRQDVLAALVKLDGLDSQAGYLLSIGRDDSDAQAITQEMQGLDRDIGKYSRPKKQFDKIPYDKFQKRFVDRPARLEARLARRQKLVERVYVYEDWDPYYSWDDDIPWWFYMVGRTDPGYGFDDVNLFLEQRPSYVFERPDPPDLPDVPDVVVDEPEPPRRAAYDAAQAAAALDQGQGAGGSWDAS